MNNNNCISFNTSLSSDQLNSALSISTVSTSVYDCITNTLSKTYLKQEEKQPEVSEETKTELAIKNGKIYVKNYEKGFFQSEKMLIPDIKDIKAYNDTTVVVIFADDTKTVAVLDSKDEFNLEQGISICLTKKLLGDNGSSIYNKLINRAFEVKKHNEDAIAQAEKKKADEKAKREEARKRLQQVHRRKREEAIEIQKEAYIRAMKEMGDENGQNTGC